MPRKQPQTAQLRAPPSTRQSSISIYAFTSPLWPRGKARQSGNLVTADRHCGVLPTVVSLDPLYVTFEATNRFISSTRAWRNEASPEIARCANR